LVKVTYVEALPGLQGRGVASMSQSQASTRSMGLWRGTRSVGKRVAHGGSSSDHGNRTGQPVLSGAAEIVVASLINGAPLDGNSRAMTNLRDAFMAESADESTAAASRCAALRSGFASALQAALRRHPEAAVLFDENGAGHTHIEVRGTARRKMQSATFLVGRTPACDVHASGDATVSRLQFVAVMLPKAIVVIDAWSLAGTRTMSRSAHDVRLLPSSTPSHRAAFLLGVRERVTLYIGKKTTLTLGPKEAEAAEQAATAIPPSIRSVNAASVPQATAIPASPSCTPTPAPRTPTLRLGEVATSPKAERPPSPDVANPAQVGVEPMPGTFAEPPSSENASGQHLGRNGSSHTRLVRCLSAVRACVRLKHAPATRAQILWRCRAAVRSRLISEEQCNELEGRVRSTPETMDEVREILDGLGVRQAPKQAAAHLKPGAKVQIHGLAATPALNGARGICEEWLADRGRWAVRLGNGELAAVKPGNVTAELPEVFVPPEVSDGSMLTLQCLAPGCSRTVMTCKNEPRQPYRCECGAAPRCTGCGEWPYHYHARCVDVPKLRERWVDWTVAGGRRAYRGLRAKAFREATAQRRALREAAEALSATPCSMKTGMKSAPPPRKRNMLAARANFIRGEGLHHFFTSCAICGSKGGCIIGPRFRCIHCPSFDCCFKCEPKLKKRHDKEHIFEILFECQFDWSQAGIELPPGTRARVRENPIGGTSQRVPDGHPETFDGDAGVSASAAAPPSTAPSGAPRPKRKVRGYGLDGVILGFKRGRYDLQLKEDGSIRHVLPGDLQPLLSQKKAKELLGDL